MKKICLFFVICLIFVFAGCGGSKNDEKTENPDSEEAVTDEDEDSDSESSDTASDPAVTDTDTADSGDKTDPTPDSGDSKTDEDPADTDPAGDTDTASDEDADSGDTTPDNDDDSTDTGMPVQEATSCTDDGVEGKLTICTGGVCQTEDCPGSNSCKNSFECGDCQNYTIECHESISGYAVYQCQAGSFKLIKECDQGCNKEWNDCGIIECTDGDTKCVNGNDGRGETYSCVDGRWERDKDWYENEIKCTGSCNREGTECGESDCLDYTIECRDDLLSNSTGGGAIAQCQYGKWQIMRACTDASSCNRESGECGECKNGRTKCEDHEISNIMNKNCNSSGNCDSGYYSATIGVQLLCYDGRWSDYNDLTRSSYCPAVSHTFQSYQSYPGGFVDWSIDMTKVFNVSATTYNDYHYSSCHNTSQVSECGTCNNNFRVCGDEPDNENSGRPYGRIQRCDNGILIYGNSCSNKNQLCQNRYQCP